jgi:hypothetical protein
MHNKLTGNDFCSASVSRGASHGESISAKGRFEIVCRGSNGLEKWREIIHNLVTTVGKNDILNKYLNGSSYTATFRMYAGSTAPAWGTAAET